MAQQDLFKNSDGTGDIGGKGMAAQFADYVGWAKVVLIEGPDGEPLAAPDPVSEAAKVLEKSRTARKAAFDEMWKVATEEFSLEATNNGGARYSITGDVINALWYAGLRALTKDGDTCRKCGGAMATGKAIAQTLTGKGDFHDADEVVTLSAGGTGKMIDCMKCANCGWSVTKDGEAG